MHATVFGLMHRMICDRVMQLHAADRSHVYITKYGCIQPQWRIFAKIQLSTFEYKVWATLGGQRPRWPAKQAAGKGAGGAAERPPACRKLLSFYTSF